MKAFQLRATCLATGVLLLGPALALWLSPRPQALGLERLLPQVALLQSFPAAPDRPVPPLWQQRLGPRLATRLWQQQRGVWWQFWGADGDGGAFLALSQPRQTTPSAVPARGLRVDDLVVVAPDPLSRRQLMDQLAAASRQRRGLERRCLERLQRGQAVYWSAMGLAQLTGPLAPLLQQVRQGCLSLEPAGRRLASGLDLTGEASATAGVLGDPAASTSPSPGPGLPPAGVLLELSGPNLAPLFNTLLARQLIREPLAARYGLGPSQLKLLTSVPFRLRLRPVARGPFQAGLDLQLAVGRRREPWAALLRDLRQGLLDQDLQEGPAQLTSSAPGSAVRSQTLPAARFSRDDGTVVGGWRWQSQAGGDPQLLLFLGPMPQSPAAPVDASSRQPLSLNLLPSALESLGLMPSALPQLVRQATQLQLKVSPGDQPLNQLSGRLRLPLVR
jgi:hypothetical protein